MPRTVAYNFFFGLITNFLTRFKFQLQFEKKNMQVKEMRLKFYVQDAWKSSLGQIYCHL